MTTLAIVESNRTKAELLCHYLTTRCGYEVVAMEYCAASAFRAVERCKPEVILASLTMPDLSATEMIAQLRSAASAARIIGLVSRCSEYLVHSLTRTGYQALFCDTDEGLAGLLQTIDHVLRGRRVVSASIVNCQLGLRSAPAAFPKLLSNRELEALICIAHSMTDEEIGRQMAISAGTAQSHRKRIMGKLGIHSTPKLISYCAEKGFQSAALPLQTLRNEKKPKADAVWLGRQMQTA